MTIAFLPPMSPPARASGLLGALAGLTLAIRPLGPQDADRYQTHVRQLSPASRRNRFLGGMNELPAAEVRRLMNASRGLVFAFAAEMIIGCRRTMVGETVYAPVPATGSAEFALSVADPWQGLGIGTRLLTFLGARAAADGNHLLFGETLRDNESMLALARKTGLSLKRHPEDSRLVRLEGPLPGIAAAR
ncbi:GNAT family N-acetyltransferase [Phreatobacter aquaticus]|uniref:GNAT family N-acetyltransferase n=1 Tax=Phreatobacter aquaticus TaxID=2570229 RepID=A0A4D7QW82_9HYPH|nr:GNAT family N-acetyltransferase [Phreatobacter aquaticus]QCK88212.1 GNAT family N-acetyltransferase [Phreatobacter aquaticus]